MASTIILLGKAEKNFQFVLKSLHEQPYRFHFISADEIAQDDAQLPDAELIIIDTLPYSEAEFNRFYPLRENPRYAHIPTLALVDENPPRLRYRLINMGIHDYLTVPFHRLDLEVRCRNLLRLNGYPAAQPETLPSPVPAIHALQSLQQLYREMNQSIFQLDRNSFIKSVLAQIHQFSKAHITFLFDVREERYLQLQHFLPSQLLSDEWQLDIADIPLLMKAVRLHEPTILNNVSADNPFVTHLNAYLNVKVRSFIIYPVVIQNHTRAVLCVLKSDPENFSELHYLLVENFAHFLVHAHFLSLLRKETENQYDNQVWQFYFEYLDQVVNQLSFGILVISKELRVKYLNENAASLLSVSSKEALYKPLTEIMSEEAVTAVMKSAAESPLTFERPELELVDRNQKKRLVGFSVQEFTDQMSGEEGFIISLKDITFTKEIQEEMRRVDRLASLGVMASGIAHEIRNPLAGIKAMAQTFEEELQPDDPKNEYVKRIVRLVNRLDDLLRTLFSYAKPPKPNRQYCNLDEVLRDVFSLMRQKLREHNIKLIKLIHPELPRAFVDPGQIQQVLVNLFLNSVEAINKNGEIVISIQPVGEKEAASKPFLSPYLMLGKAKSFIEIQIRDNGCGISEENLKHIFNPFFTTKTFGTGLGLSIVYQIIKENEGLINYESEVDQGTTCFLYLPAELSGAMLLE